MFLFLTNRLGLRHPWNWNVNFTQLPAKNISRAPVLSPFTIVMMRRNHRLRGMPGWTMGSPQSMLAAFRAVC